MPSTTVRRLCDLLEVSALDVANDIELHGITTLDAASERDVSFLFRPKMRKQALASKAAVILVPAGLDFNDPRAVSVPNVWIAILKLIEFFHPSPKPRAFIHPTAIVSEDARLGAEVFVGPYSIIEEGTVIGDRTRIEAHAILGAGVHIGNDCMLHARVTLAEGSRIGNRVIIHSGAIIGSDGFKYEVIAQHLTKIPQIGAVVVEDDVEIGANATIDRASFHETRIGARTKIDNLVHIAHNAQIGSDCILVAQTGIAGSAKLGRGVILGGQVGVADNVVIGDGVKVGAQGGVAGSFVAPGSELWGTPAMDLKAFMQMTRIMRKMPKMYAQLVEYIGSQSTEVDEEN